MQQFNTFNCSTWFVRCYLCGGSHISPQQHKKKIFKTSSSNSVTFERKGDVEESMISKYLRNLKTRKLRRLQLKKRQAVKLFCGRVQRSLFQRIRLANSRMQVSIQYIHAIQIVCEFSKLYVGCYIHSNLDDIHSQHGKT